jgi:hypothetical protein
MVMVPLPQRRPDRRGEPVKFADDRKSDQGSADSDQQQNRMLWGTHTY